jgi:type I restriction enzyme, S subunit
MRVENVRLEDICEISIGKTPPRKQPEYWGEGHKWLSIRDMAQGRLLVETKETITQKAVNEGASGRLVQPGTVVMSFKLSIGKLGIAQVPLYTNEAIAALEICDHDRLIPGYLYHALGSANLMAGTDRAVMGKTLNKRKLRLIQIHLPPLPEQRRIAAILDKADAVRRKRQQSLDLADQFLRSAFLDMFGDPVTNPKGWPVKELGKLADIRSGVTKGPRLGDSETISVPYMRVANVQDGKLDLSDIKEIEIRPNELEKFRLRKGDLLLTEGGDPDKLGRGSIWTGEVDPCVHQNHIFSVRIDHTIAHPYYVSALIGSAYGKRHFLRAGKQTTGIATINKTQLRAFPALLPPVELQRCYAKIVTDYASVFERLATMLSTHESLSDSLTQRAFRGEL